MKELNKRIDLFKVFMAPTAAEEVSKVLNSGFIGQGPKVTELERKLERFLRLENSEAITYNSATSAEHLAYHLLKKPSTISVGFDGIGEVVEKWPGLEEGDEVLTTALTCTATNWPILANGLKIKWVDIDPTTMNICLKDLESKLTAKTKIVTVVHWGGYPVDLVELSSIQKRYKKKFGFSFMIIDDAAHAMGSKLDGKSIGAFETITTFSLQAIKHITSVDGGFWTSPFKELNKRAKLTRWYGIDREGPRTDFRCESDIPEWGFKFHMNDICATVGLSNLEHAEYIVAKHKSNGAFYNRELQGISGVTLLENDPRKESAYWLYTMRVENRDGFMKYMNENGVSTSRVHERNDKHTCTSEFVTSLPNVDLVSKDMICIPVGWWVTEEDRQYIVDLIKKGW
jgi:dTDP-4-amino-4,6-dideoxygalactose transaminase